MKWLLYLPALIIGVVAVFIIALVRNITPASRVGAWCDKALDKFAADVPEMEDDE